MMKNRVGVTLRFNLKEQANLRALAEFWGISEKDALKLAFEQLVNSTNQLQEKLKKEKENEEANNQNSNSESANSAGADTNGTDEGNSVEAAS
jgi:Holliday junction resolvasome RuvABC DNA-binding subunit